MFKKVLKGLFSFAVLIVMSGAAIVEIGIELSYQIVRLIRRGYGYCLDKFLTLVEPVYNGKLKIKMNRKEIKETDKIKIYEFDY